MTDLTAKLFVLLQRLLPKHLLTAIVHWAARIRAVPCKNFLIRHFIRAYAVDVEEVLLPVPDGFDSFNAFFIRQLKESARDIDESMRTIVSPVDGTVSAMGKIDKDRIFQAKGSHYSLTDLLATDTADAHAYIDGVFATIYLAPHNYHRVHAPLAGELVALRYVPGKLFSVNEATVRHLPGLFVRNERLICHLATEAGPLVLVFVGAMNVGSISTRWSGEIRPRKTGVVDDIRIRDIDSGLRFARGDLLGWFNMGSTVILLHPPGTVSHRPRFTAGQSVRMGEAIGQCVPAK
jgi:phosphatidylserine decarboxylase